MARFSREAGRQVAALRRYYLEKERPEAARNLREALRRASERIDREPEAGLVAPRPYPKEVAAGRRWIKEGRYWIAYRLDSPATILAVIFDQADLPRRV